MSASIKDIPMPEAAVTFGRFLDETYPRLMDGLRTRPGTWVVGAGMPEHLLDVFQVPLLDSAVDLLEEGQPHQEFESNRFPKAAVFNTSHRDSDRESVLRIGQTHDGRNYRAEYYRKRPLDEAGGTPPLVQTVYYARTTNPDEKGDFIDDLAIEVERTDLRAGGQLELGGEQQKRVSLKGRFSGLQLAIDGVFTELPTGVAYEAIGSQPPRWRGVAYGIKEPELTLVVGQPKGVRQDLTPKLPLRRGKRQLFF